MVLIAHFSSVSQTWWNL